MKYKLAILIFLISGNYSQLFSQIIVNGRGIDLNPEVLVLYDSNNQFEPIGIYEFGVKTDGYYMINGKYPELSYRILLESDLLVKSKNELQIMRNEIFERYSYDFKAGGEMKKYFKETNWYRHEYKNVDNFLTEIKKYNIKLIHEFE